MYIFDSDLHVIYYSLCGILYYIYIYVVLSFLYYTDVIFYNFLPMSKFILCHITDISYDSIVLNEFTIFQGRLIVHHGRGPRCCITIADG